MKLKRFEEYFAKVILESCFPDKFVNLKVSDKPDLHYGNKIGIEVTNCMPTRVAEAFNLWHRAAKQGEQTPPRIIERLEQLEEVQCDEKGLVWNQGTYNDDMANSPIKYFLKAVKKKVERLNSSNADYSKMDSYELFVNSFILIPFEQPSYISLDYVLSAYSLIPEAVYSITSATSNNSKIYNNAFGCFIYSHIPKSVFSLGIKEEVEGGCS